MCLCVCVRKAHPFCAQVACIGPRCRTGHRCPTTSGSKAHQINQKRILNLQLLGRHSWWSPLYVPRHIASLHLIPKSYLPCYGLHITSACYLESPQYSEGHIPSNTIHPNKCLHHPFIWNPHAIVHSTIIYTTIVFHSL